MNSLKAYFRIQDLYRYTKQLEMWKEINNKQILKNYNMLHDKTYKTKILSNYKQN